MLEDSLRGGRLEWRNTLSQHSLELRLPDRDSFISNRAINVLRLFEFKFRLGAFRSLLCKEGFLLGNASLRLLQFTLTTLLNDAEEPSLSRWTQSSEPLWQSIVRREGLLC